MSPERSLQQSRSLVKIKHTAFPLLTWTTLFSINTTKKFLGEMVDNIKMKLRYQILSSCCHLSFHLKGNSHIPTPQNKQASPLGQA